MVSQVSVMPRRSMLLLATRSDRAGASSHMERALTVPRQIRRTPGPGLRLISPARKSHNQAGPGVVAAFFGCNKGKEMEQIPKMAKRRMI